MKLEPVCHAAGQRLDSHRHVNILQGAGQQLVAAVIRRTIVELVEDPLHVHRPRWFRRSVDIGIAVDSQDQQTGASVISNFKVGIRVFYRPAGTIAGVAHLLDQHKSTLIGLRIGQQSGDAQVERIGQRGGAVIGDVGFRIVGDDFGLTIIMIQLAHHGVAVAHGNGHQRVGAELEEVDPAAVVLKVNIEIIDTKSTIAHCRHAGHPGISEAV